MTRLSVKISLIIILGLYLPIQSMAWGQLGHRIVAEIANGYLTPKAKIEVAKILGTESLAISSTWADFIRSDSNYKYLAQWHYIDFTGEITLEKMSKQLETDTMVNAYTKLNFLIKQLRNKNLLQNEKQLYLRMLVHIVGDIHQPLHVSPRGDNGANSIKLNWFNDPSNLHRVWDENLIQYQELSYTEYVKAINFSSLSERAKWQKQAISEWLFESYTKSVEIRTQVKDGDKLGFVYNFKNIGTVNQQLLKAGVRLAGILNDIFK